jgi:hypothetical protein
MNLYEAASKRQAHPGWSLLTKDGNWLSYAHGWHVVEDAFYARIFHSEEAAKEALVDMQEDFQGGIECDIVPAWEPLCGQLRHEVKILSDANKISPSDLMEVWLAIENIKGLLKLE